MKKSERLKPKRKINFKYFILAHILTLFFVLASFSFAADNSFDFNARKGYEEPFSKLVEFLNGKKNELEKIIAKGFDIVAVKPPRGGLTATIPSVSFLMAAVSESVKEIIVDKPRQYVEKVFCVAKDFVFPGACRDKLESQKELSTGSALPTSENGAEEMTALNLKHRYEEAIDEASALSQKFNLLQSEMEKIKAGGVIVRQPVIEQKTIEKTVEKIISGLSQSDLDSGLSSLKTELDNLNANLTNQINNLSSNTSRQSTAAFHAISLTNKIDSLTNTTLTTPTITNPTITGTLTNQTLSNSGNATISGSLSAGGTSLSSLTVSGTTGLTGLAAIANSTTTNATVTDNFWSNGSTRLFGGQAYIGDADADALTIRSGVWSLTSTATSTVAMTNGLNFDSNTFAIDPNSNRVGIGTSTPQYTMDVDGTLRATSLITSGQTIGGDFAVTGQTTMTTATATQLTVSNGAWFTGGNVGIGTTSPSTKLSVGGAAGDETGHGYFTGGLGVGVLNTVANSFRVGQCVTGDTKLRRRRRRRKSVGKRSALFGDSRADLEETEIDDDYIYDEVAIKDIVAGDEIASLDEKTGKIVWSKVKQLAYMGKKQTYRLSTEDGRQIRATANHPYLTEQGWTKVSDLRVGMPIAVPQNKGKGRQKPRIGVFVDGGNMYHTSNRSGWRVDFDKLKKLLSASVDLAFINYHIVTPQENDQNYSKTLSHIKIASKSFIVLQKPMKYIWSEEEKRKVKKGDVDVDLAIDVVNSISELDAAVVISGDSDYLALENYTAQYGKPVIFMGYKQNMAWELRLKNHIFLELLRKFIEYGAKTNSDLSAGATLTSSIIHNAILESSAAVDNSMAWAKIRSIEPVAEEDVYDVEIENTHNFIGNDIVAHNTAFMVGADGKTGVGTSTPNWKLSVAGAGSFDDNVRASYFTATSTTATSTFPYLSVTTNSNLGTVIGGTWQGTAIGAQYGGTGLNSSALTGLAQIVSGTWSASSTLSTAFGGTGWNNLQANTVLLGNGAGRIATTTAGTDGYVLALSAGVPTWLATSTLSTITGTLAVAKGGTGQTSFGQGWLNSDGTTLSASTSPTVNYIYATSTTATSTFAGGMSVAGSSGLTVLQNGNVGIGTTSPSTKLSVGGAAGDTTGHGYFTGGLGVGMLNTTAGTFNVLGQCVTGDTKLRRRRRKKSVGKRSALLGDSRADLEETDFDDDYIYDEVAIKDIVAGDEIASLNEQTGKIVWSKVNALMDMGVKKIYKIATASGKTIRTTAEHPYLVKKKETPSARAIAFIDYANIKAWIRGKNLSVDLKALYSALKDAGVSDVRFYYGTDAKNDKIGSFFSKLSSFGYSVITKPVQYFKIALSELLNQQSNKRWLEIMDAPLKTSLLDEAVKLDEQGIEFFAPKANFDVEISVDAFKNYNSASVFILFSGDGDFAYLLKTLKKFGKRSVIVSGRKSLSGTLMKEADKFVTLERLGEKIPDLFAEKQNPPHGRVLKKCTSNISDLLGLSNCPVDNLATGENGSWTKVAYLKEGMEIAVSDKGGDKSVWDSVVKIEILPDEQVYDIEIEGTRNFIGNDIVAHNTYLGGNVGIGTTGPLNKFHVRNGAGTAVTGDGNTAKDALIEGATNVFTSINPNLGIVANSVQAANNMATIGFGAKYSGNAYAFFSEIGGIDEDGSGTPSGALAFATRTGGGQMLEKMRINNLGNVGIGMSNPTAKLDITGGNIQLDNTQGIYFRAVGGAATTNIGMNGDNVTDVLTFRTAATDKMTIRGGNVGIGTTTPTRLLEISGTAAIFSIDRTSGTTLSEIELKHANVSKAHIGISGATNNGIVGSVANDLIIRADIQKILFSTNSGDTGHMVIDTAGNVGIGTTGPGTPLEVNRASDGGILRLSRQGVASWDFGVRNTPTLAGLQAGSLEILPQTGNTDFSVGAQGGAVGLVVKNSGNVGIGTASPGSNSKLDVQGYITAPQNSGGYIFDNNTLLGMRYDNNSLRASAYDHIDFYTYSGGSYNEKVRITSAGNVGIGTVSPVTKFQVAGGNIQMDNGQGIYFRGVGGTAAPNNGMTGNDATDILTFRTGAVDRMTISGGNVGIGTTTPGYKLDVVGAVRVTGGTDNTVYLDSTYGGVNNHGIKIREGGWGSPYPVWGMVQNNVNQGLQFAYEELASGFTFASPTNVMTLLKGGNVGIGTTTPWRTLSVTGTVGFDGLTSAVGAGSLCLDSNKQVVYNSASDACLSSTRATKHNIQELNLDGLSLVSQLQPSSFIYNQGDSRTRYGFIAEDTALMDDKLTTHNEKGEITGIDDRAIMSVAVKAIKELNLKVSDLQASVAASGGTGSDGLFAWMLNKFKSSGITLEYDAIKVKNVEAEKVAANDFEMKDKGTGEIYCVNILNGEWNKVKGVCGAPAPASSSSSSNSSSSESSSSSSSSESLSSLPAGEAGADSSFASSTSDALPSQSSSSTSDVIPATSSSSSSSSSETSSSSSSEASSSSSSSSSSTEASSSSSTSSSEAAS